MPKINTIIPTQGFEIVRNRIADIFIDEIANQYLYTGDSDLRMNVSVEKKNTFDKSELTQVNIYLANGDFDNQHPGQSDGTFKYNFDVIGSSPDTDQNTGDSLASILVQKILGKGYAILTNAQYRQLGFQSSGVQPIKCGQMDMGEINQGDARNIIIGRFVITVKLTQDTSLLLGTLADGYDTQIKIGSSDIGFSYTIDN